MSPDFIYGRVKHCKLFYAENIHITVEENHVTQLGLGSELTKTKSNNRLKATSLAARKV